MAGLALYKAPGTRLDRLIRWRTRSIYSHVEIVIGSSWYTSSPRDGGVRRKEIVPTPGHWDFVPVGADIERVVQLYSRTMGQGYDWLGIAGHAIGLPRINWSTRWTCSEWCAEALGLPRAWRWTPESLALNFAGGVQNKTGHMGRLAACSADDEVALAYDLLSCLFGRSGKP